MRVLVINVGSSSLKHALVETTEARVVSSAAERWEPEDAPGRHAEALRTALAGASLAPEAIGHRVVHGGSFRGPHIIDPAVRQRIAELCALAPLHNRAALEGIEAASAAFEGLVQVASFDTAFHATLSGAAATYPVPAAWTERYGLRRFGFHGLNVEWCTRRAAELLGRDQARRLVVCHLGSGSSVTAVIEGRSLDTSMGFTPLEGVPMATRSGSVDPGMLLYLMRRGLSADQLDQGLNHESGLLGVSGVSADLRAVLDAEQAGDARAALAFEVLVRGVAGAVAAMAASLGGIDCLVFTAGMGEGSARLRAEVARRLEHLGLALDASRNDAATPDSDIAAPDSKVRALVVAAGEELVIAAQTEAAIAARARDGGGGGVR